PVDVALGRQPFADRAHDYLAMPVCGRRAVATGAKAGCASMMRVHVDFSGIAWLRGFADDIERQHRDEQPAADRMQHVEDRYAQAGDLDFADAAADLHPRGAGTGVWRRVA